MSVSEYAKVLNTIPEYLKDAISDCRVTGADKCTYDYQQAIFDVAAEYGVDHSELASWLGKLSGAKRRGVSKTVKRIKQSNEDPFDMSDN